MKKSISILVIFIGLTIPLFAQNETDNELADTPQGKHNPFDMYFGVSLGASGMRTSNNGILTTNLGVNYGFYFFSWLSINTGILFHTEIYSDQNLLTGNNPMQTPLCFTIPFGFYFNIPKVEWLYTGVNLAVNIPIADLRSPGEQDFHTQSDVFLSMPIDFGFDFIKPGRGGSRLLFRVTPTFHKGGTVVPVGVMWQIYNWKVFSKKVEVDVKVEVNVPPPPPPPTIIITR